MDSHTPPIPTKAAKLLWEPGSSNLLNITLKPIFSECLP